MTLDILLLVVFITLKLCGVIAWSWLWVLSPLWIRLILLIIANLWMKLQAWRIIQTWRMWN